MKSEIECLPNTELLRAYASAIEAHEELLNEMDDKRDRLDAWAKLRDAYSAEVMRRSKERSL